MQCDTVQYTDSPQRIDIEVDGEEEGGGKEEQGQGCADSTVGLSKNMLGLQEWLNDIRLLYISGVGISGWFDVAVTEGRGAAVSGTGVVLGAGHIQHLLAADASICSTARRRVKYLSKRTRKRRVAS